MRVNEIFHSIQGEGFHSGRPADFIRFQGCHVGCTFCDTKHSWDKAGGTEQSIEQIIDQLKTSFVILTGGEPLEQNLNELFNALKHAGKEVALETSGTRVISQTYDWLTLSPKNFVKTSLPEFLKFADELKFIYTDKSSEDFIFKCIQDAEYKPLVYIQPNGLSKKSTREAVEFVKRYNFRLSLQTHKFIGIE